MRKLEIGKNDAGQRMDKYLKKYFREAGSGFLYKMLRKKNIVLNGKKAEGKEILAKGDIISLYLAEETIEKFRGKADLVQKAGKVYPVMPLEILYEDENLLFINKPAGVLSQKASSRGCFHGRVFDRISFGTGKNHRKRAGNLSSFRV